MKIFHFWGRVEICPTQSVQTKFLTTICQPSYEARCSGITNIYRLQKVMFSQVSVCSQGGEGVLGKGGTCGKGGHVWQRWHAWQGACVVGGHAWQGGVSGGGMAGRACVAGGGHGRRDGHCSRRYASYWNAFLSHILLFSWHFNLQYFLLHKCFYYNTKLNIIYCNGYKQVHQTNLGVKGAVHCCKLDRLVMQPMYSLDHKVLLH